MATVELRFTALPEHVRTARLVAVSLARQAGVDDETLDEVRLAVGEAATRAVGRHRASCPAEPVLVRLSDGDGRFVAEVVDVARGPVGPRHAGRRPTQRRPRRPRRGRPGRRRRARRAAPRRHRPGRHRQPRRRRDASGATPCGSVVRMVWPVGAGRRRSRRGQRPGRLWYAASVCVDSARRAVPGVLTRPSAAPGQLDRRAGRCCPQTGGHMAGTALASVGESISFTSGNVTTLVVVAVDRARRPGRRRAAGPGGARRRARAPRR